MNTSHSTVPRAAAVSLLSGAAVLAAAPAHAAPNPEAPVAGGHQSRVAVDGHLAAGPGVSGVSPEVQSKIEIMERASQGRWAVVPEQPASGTQDSDPSSLPLVMLTLLSGGVVTGAAGFTVYRFRHHGPVGAATA